MPVFWRLLRLGAGGKSELTFNKAAAESYVNPYGTEELAHLEIIGSIVGQLTDGEGAKSFDRYGKADYYVDHANAVYAANASGVPFTAAYFQSKADPIADLMEDLAAEQKARVTYENILRLTDDPDVREPIKFLRQREINHYQRFAESLGIAQDAYKDKKNFYYYNPAFDRVK